MKNILVHIHIPKTAGTSLLSILDKNYSVQRLPNTQGWRDFKLDDKANCISGHVPLGSFKLNSKIDAKYITCLRHPIDRLMSFYFYVMQRGERNNWFKKIQRMSLNQFLVSDVLDNEMARMIGGVKGRRLVTNDDLTLASANLILFDYIAMTEDIENDIQRMGKLLNWQHIPAKAPHALKSKNPGKEQLPESVYNNAIAKHHYDMELYFSAHRIRYYNNQYGIPRIVNQE
jgi:hypothetical protein